MGQSYAPSYANIYMSEWEREALAKHRGYSKRFLRHIKNSTLASLTRSNNQDAPPRSPVLEGLRPTGSPAINLTYPPNPSPNPVTNGDQGAPWSEGPCTFLHLFLKGGGSFSPNLNQPVPPPGSRFLVLSPSVNDPKTRTRQMNESFNSRPCVWINDRVNLPTESSADVSATQSKLISPVTAVRAAHGKIARHLHTAARPPGHERESTELLIRTLPAHPAGPPHPRTQSLICC
ncbi:unnamed protein product [Pleuronectes platessa]|uniref:Uncharacterized protein n=1 Tax=Pleuronectes platessa TaxID=8262 RepID=A0A9N7YUH9_PLEPL|nr:unnamed protein product [Pleuronectes platessa]